MSFVISFSIFSTFFVDSLKDCLASLASSFLKGLSSSDLSLTLKDIRSFLSFLLSKAISCLSCSRFSSALFNGSLAFLTFSSKGSPANSRATIGKLISTSAFFLYASGFVLRSLRLTWFSGLTPCPSVPLAEGLLVPTVRPATTEFLICSGSTSDNHSSLSSSSGGNVFISCPMRLCCLLYTPKSTSTTIPYKY